MKLINKITWLSTALGTLLVLILIALSLYSFRHFSLTSAENISRTAAEIVRVSMTEAMINGVVDKRASFLARLQAIEGLRHARIVRGPGVSNQFGTGLIEEKVTDSVEEQVLREGLPYFGMEEDQGRPVFRATIPYIATNLGEPNCLNCHQVEAGSVLGAVSITLSIEHLKQQALLIVSLMMLPLIIIAIFLIVLFRRMIKPLSNTAKDLQITVEQALEGDFTGRIESRTTDEIGLIAGEVNQLMGFLYDGLNVINKDVAQLTRIDPAKKDMLASTQEMVSRLTEAAHFKQSIEEDETRQEVYQRLSRVIEDDFAVSRFSIYEVANSKNRISAAVVDGLPNADCRWCDQQILIRSEACRARRTGHSVDSVETPSICNSFRPGKTDEPMRHICLPVLQSGSVGSVVQLVFPEQEAQRVQESVPFLNVFLRESAPVIESKRLMDTLRESNLTDPMTGLHNRRFLEEYIETLVASVQRKDMKLAILMLDLDYFKKVNDTHGHDAGDSVLKALAKILSGSVRASDLVIRYGGEEFLIILQDTTDDYGNTVAEKIRVAVESAKFSVPGGTLKKTISVGVADFPTDSDTFWQALKYADVALYKAKNEGRNRVIHFLPEMWSEEGEY
jgi:diguanylate cyclase (GGDEF)-like protein